MKIVKLHPYGATAVSADEVDSLYEVIKCLKICVANIKRMALHGCIVEYNHGSREEHGLYGLYVSYKNGKAKIYIADEGLVMTIVATDFDSKEAL